MDKKSSSISIWLKTLKRDTEQEIQKRTNTSLATSLCSFMTIHFLFNISTHFYRLNRLSTRGAEQSSHTCPYLHIFIHVTFPSYSSNYYCYSFKKRFLDNLHHTETENLLRDTKWNKRDFNPGGKGGSEIKCQLSAHICMPNATNF